MRGARFCRTVSTLIAVVEGPSFTILQAPSSGESPHAPGACALRRHLVRRRHLGAAAIAAHDFRRARLGDDRGTYPGRRRGLARRGRGDAQCRHGGRGLLALRPASATAAAPSAAGVVSREKLAAQLATLPQGDLLLRGDSVGFPPGGCAFLHRHWGPGIRCLIEGGIRIDTHGRSTSYGPGGAWYETGPDAVFAQAAADRPSRFIRVMVLPRELIGKSSFRYVNEADKEKPRVQQYKISWTRRSHGVRG